MPQPAGARWRWGPLGRKPPPGALFESYLRGLPFVGSVGERGFRDRISFPVVSKVFAGCGLKHSPSVPLAPPPISGGHGRVFLKCFGVPVREVKGLGVSFMRTW